MASIKGWLLKNVKTWEGRDGIGLQASIYYHGRKVGQFTDYGDGSEPDLDIANKEIRDILKADTKSYFEEHPLQDYIKAGLTPDEDEFINELTLLMDYEKFYKKELQKGKNVIAVVEHNEGTSLFSLSGAGTMSVPKFLKLYKNTYHKDLDSKTITFYTCLEDFNIQ